MTGGCLCGSVRYSLHAKPLITALCHCKHCQRTSGSAFSINVMMRAEDVTVEGEVARFADVGESGAPVTRCFCPRCGSSLLSVLAPETGLLAIKAGTLDDTGTVEPTAEFWCRSAQAWAPRHPQMVAFETVRGST